MFLNLRNFRKFLFYLVVFLIPFNIKKYLFTFPSPFKISLSYNAAFLYLVDILILLLFILSFKEIKSNFSSFKIFYLFLASTFFSFLNATNLYSFFYTLFHIFLFVTFGVLTGIFILQKEINLKYIFLILGISASVESVLAFLQFKNQSSLGLKFLGESVLTINTPGVARVFTDEGNFLRVYGTMPHANILAAFLVLGFLSFLYLFLREKRFIFLVPIFFIFFASFLTFSRSGIFTLFLGSVASIFYSLIHKDLRKWGLYLCLFLLIFVLISYLVLGNLFGARFYLSTKEPSFYYRVDYNLIGFLLIKQFPLFGVGLGNQIEKALDLGFYQKYNLKESWQWQPIHNIYLLSIAEVGIVGFLFFLYLIVSIFLKAFLILKKNIFKKECLDIFYPFLIGCLFLILGLVDHFLWDLTSGGLMFFLVLGILKGESEVLKAYEENNKDFKKQIA
jgi:O-antigen ligase